MNKTRFSIITICYNAENEIESTLKSVLNQNYLPLEYLIVDGSSTDKTNEIIKEYLPGLKKKGIIVKYSSQKDRGISDAFNKGIMAATGDVIGLINAGDCLMPHSLEYLNQAFQEPWDIIYGKTLCIDKKHNLKYLRQIPDNLDLNKMKYNGLVFTHQSAFVRKKIYDDYGLYDISYKYVMDSDLFLHFYTEGASFHYIDYTLVSMLSGGVSSRSTHALLKENIRISEKYGGYSKQRLYLNWIKGIPRRIVVNILRNFPAIWYRSIGKDRIWKDEN